ncbi:MAG: branched-chain amino acid ABC transporter permease [Pseudomonadota bacterium]
MRPDGPKAPDQRLPRAPNRTIRRFCARWTGWCRGQNAPPAIYFRSLLVGINVYALRLASFVIAGFFAGVAGALFALFGRYASASYMFYHVSGEAVVWAIVGGAGTLLGPVVGAGVLILVREELSLYWDHYLLLVGAITVLTVIFAPRGIVGLYGDLVARAVSGLDRPERGATSDAGEGEGEAVAETRR